MVGGGRPRDPSTAGEADFPGTLGQRRTNHERLGNNAPKPEPGPSRHGLIKPRISGCCQRCSETLFHTCAKLGILDQAQALPQHHFGVRPWPLWGTALPTLGYGPGHFGVRPWPLWGTALATLGYGPGHFGVRPWPLWGTDSAPEVYLTS